MNCRIHHTIVIGVLTLAAIALVGVLTLNAFGKPVSAEITGLGGIAIGGLLGHLGVPKKEKDN
jgi:hypothetical protein